MKYILVITEDYPSILNRYPMAYVHTRNLLYKQYNKNICIDVLSFKTKKNYHYDGIDVFCEKSIGKNLEKYDAIVSHAINIKNHLRFLLVNSSNIDNTTFFIHGHEVLKVHEYYPQPYPWSKQSNQVLLTKIYDSFKLLLLSKFFRSNKSFKFIFVSNWMKKEALKNLNLSFLPNTHVIHNPVNSNFTVSKYNTNTPKDFDFITVRPLDSPKYCIDIVYEIAKNFPNYSFKVIGKGSFFEHNYKLKNISWDDNFYTPEELTLELDKAKVALMPTRLDAQGVMMCEIASFGMPIITSKIDICYEMLSEYEGAYFISNNNYINDFKNIVDDVLLVQGKDLNTDSLILDKFNTKQIVSRELETILES